MKKLYLVQHAEAMSEEEDPERPITPRGRSDSIAVALALKGLEVEIDQIRHSGKTRAAQTGGIFAQHLSPPGGLNGAPGLGPVDNVQPAAEEINDSDQNLMLVGHLPFMSRIAGYLITGDPDHAVVEVKNAAVICLVQKQDHWLVEWILTPDMAS